MLTKFLSAAAFSFFAFTSHAQNETQIFKFNPAPFNSKTPLHQQFLKPLPKIKNIVSDTTKSNYKTNYKTNLGEVFIDPQDGMQVLKPYPQSTGYENRPIVKPYAASPFGKPSYIDPMPNPLHHALISEDKTK